MKWLPTCSGIPRGNTSTSWFGWWDSISVSERNRWPSPSCALFVWWQVGWSAPHFPSTQMEMAHHCWRSICNGKCAAVSCGFCIGSIQEIDARLVERHPQFWLITISCLETYGVRKRDYLLHNISKVGWIPDGSMGYRYMCNVTMWGICLWSFCAQSEGFLAGDVKAYGQFGYLFTFLHDMVASNDCIDTNVAHVSHALDCLMLSNLTSFLIYQGKEQHATRACSRSTLDARVRLFFLCYTKDRNGNFNTCRQGAIYHELGQYSELCDHLIHASPS